MVGAGAASAQDAKLSEKGAKVYAAQKCSMCHSIAGKGNAKGSLDDVGSKLKLEEIRQWVVEPAAMTVEAGPITERDAEPHHAPSAGIRLTQVKEELVAWLKTLVSAAVYAILIVTFGFQVARVEGQSMAPTLEDQDRLIVNKLVYRIGEPRRGDIVMLYYPLNPEKSFVKRVIAEEATPSGSSTAACM